MDDNKFLSKLSQNLLEILDDNEYYDITIEVGNDPYVKIFRAHMVILNYRSPYLRRILSTNKKKNDDTLTHIKLPNIFPEIFQIILRYIYGGRLTLEDYSTSDIIKILVTASELGLFELISHLQSFLIENQSNWMEQNFNYIYQTCFNNVSFSEIRKYCTDLMSKKPDKLFKSLDFTSIPEKLLVSLIQNDNLQMSEIQVWEHVLKWGLARNPELPSDPVSFSRDEFHSLKSTLKRCIPLIRFYHLTSKEFFGKVLPYKKILPKELYKDLLKHFLDYDYYGFIDSKIITFQHAELISKWIDRLDITDKIKNSYEFKLILRGSRDGFTPKTFHEICDNQSHTVSIIKVKDSNEILGGYNPIEWKSSEDFIDYGVTKDSFIFSFNDNDRIENHILSRVKDETYAICYWSYYGPSFGGDIIIYGGNFCDSLNNYSYERPLRESRDDFSVEEYEIFQIIKN